MLENKEKKKNYMLSWAYFNKLDPPPETYIFEIGFYQSISNFIETLRVWRYSE